MKKNFDTDLKQLFGEQRYHSISTWLKREFGEKTSETIQGMEEQAAKTVNYLDLQKALKALDTERASAQEQFDKEKAVQSLRKMLP